jgi:hypothetical protein
MESPAGEYRLRFSRKRAHAFVKSALATHSPTPSASSRVCSAMPLRSDTFSSPLGDVPGSRYSRGPSVISLSTSAVQPRCRSLLGRHKFP